MKKIVLTAALIAACAAYTTEAKPKKAKSETVALKTAKDSTSYAFGLEFAKSINQTLSNLPGGPYNKDLLLDALNKMIKDDTLTLAFPEKNANEIIQKNLKLAQDAENQKRMEEQKQFLANNKKRPGVIETPSGLQYEILKRGDGTKPNSVNSRVKVHYAGTLMDGKEFDSSYKRGEPAEFELKNVIKGWTEGLQLMPVGSKWELYIPQELAYGERQAGQIKPFSTLIFTVELLGIERDEAEKSTQTTIGNTATKKVSKKK